MLRKIVYTSGFWKFINVTIIGFWKFFHDSTSGLQENQHEAVSFLIEAVSCPSRPQPE
jgi:hypothetical protein